MSGWINRSREAGRWNPPGEALLSSTPVSLVAAPPSPLGSARLSASELGENRVIDHAGLRVSNPSKSRLFYERALAPLGYRMLFEVPKEFTGGLVALGFGVPPKPDFWMSEGTPNEPRIHVAFRADNRKQVDDFYKAALAAGGSDNGPPGPRPHYHKDYYGAFVLDPDGHNIEAVFHGP